MAENVVITTNKEPSVADIKVALKHMQRMLNKKMGRAPETPSPAKTGTINFSLKVRKVEVEKYVEKAGIQRTHENVIDDFSVVLSNAVNAELRRVLGDQVEYEIEAMVLRETETMGKVPVMEKQKVMRGFAGAEVRPMLPAE